MFKFTIRELLLLTLVVGLGVAWWMDRNNLLLANYESIGATLDAKREGRLWEERARFYAFCFLNDWTVEWEPGSVAAKNHALRVVGGSAGAGQED